MLREILLSELQLHNQVDSLWIAINGKVYDITKFLNEHPGGEEVLLESAGTDSTTIFEDVNHSSDARKMLTDYEIGLLVEDEGKTIENNVAQMSKKNDSSIFNMTWTNWLIPSLIAIGVALVYRVVAGRYQ